jgi:hypothetical protein
VPEPCSITCAPGTYVPSGSRFPAPHDTQPRRHDAPTQKRRETNPRRPSRQRHAETHEAHIQKPEPCDSAHSGPVPSDERRIAVTAHDIIFTRIHTDMSMALQGRHGTTGQRRHGSHAATQRTRHTPQAPHVSPLHRPPRSHHSSRATQRCCDATQSSTHRQQPRTHAPDVRYTMHHTTLRCSGRAVAPAPSKRTARANHSRQPQRIDMLGDVDSAAVTGRGRRPDTVTRTAGRAYL